MNTLLPFRLLALVPLLASWCSAATAFVGEPVRLLDGKLTLELGDGFASDKDKTAPKQSIAEYKARKGDAWGSILRGTHGLQPDGLNAYMTKKVADYTKGLSWLPHLTWLKKEIVTIDGRQWTDMRFISQREGAKDPHDGLMYTRIFATSYGGQLLEIMFTSNTDPTPTTKKNIDHIIESVKLVE